MTYVVLEPAIENSRWNWQELRRVANVRRAPNSNSDRELLALSAHTGVRPRPEDGGRQLPSAETVSNYWTVEHDDLVFNPMWAIEGGVAVSEYAGAVSTAYRIYCLGPDIYPRFAHHFFRSSLAIAQYRLMVRGVTTFDRSVTREDFEAMPMPVPPLAEQRAIADYLDAETARIDALITKKQQLIHLLEERWSVRVSYLVWGSTKRRTRLKFLCGLPTSGNREHGAFTEDDTGVPCLRGLNIRPGALRLSDLRFISAEQHHALSATQLREGDIVVVRSGLAGSAVAIPPALQPCNCVDLVVVRRSGLVRPKFLEFVINSEEAQSQVAQRSAGALLTHFNAVDAGNLHVPDVPLAEQDRILASLGEEHDCFARTVKAATRQVELMREKRSSLVTSLVSGTTKRM